MTIPTEQAGAMEAFVSVTCGGEHCFCGEPAVRKVGEEIPFDDPRPRRHNLTAYVCARHFAEIMGPLGAEHVGYTRATPPVDEGIVERFRANVLISSTIRGGRFNDVEDHEVRAILRAALAAAPPDDRLRVAREALEEIAALGRGRKLNWGDADDAIRIAKEAIATLGEPAQSGEGK